MNGARLEIQKLFNPFLDNHDYSRFNKEITVFGDEMCVQTSGVANVWSQIKKMFTHLKLWVAVASHNFKWVKI